MPATSQLAKRMRCVNALNWKPLPITGGKVYEVVSEDPEGYVAVIDDDGDISTYHTARFEAV